MKRSLSLLLALVLCFSLFAGTACAQDVDISGLSYDDLLILRDRVEDAIDATLDSYDPELADYYIKRVYGCFDLDKDGLSAGPGIFRIDFEIPMDVAMTVWFLGYGDPSMDLFAYNKLFTVFDVTEVPSILFCYCVPYADYSGYDKVLMVLVTKDQFQAVPMNYKPYDYYKYFTVRYASRMLYPDAAAYVEK